MWLRSPNMYKNTKFYATTHSLSSRKTSKQSRNSLCKASWQRKDSSLVLCSYSSINTACCMYALFVFFQCRGGRVVWCAAQSGGVSLRGRTGMRTQCLPEAKTQPIISFSTDGRGAFGYGTTSGSRGTLGARPPPLAPKIFFHSQSYIGSAIYWTIVKLTSQLVKLASSRKNKWVI